jgi:hypothetical protein
MSARSDRERRVELLVGCRVFDRAGHAVGRIEEMQVEKEGNHHVVSAFDLGPLALLERLSVRHLGVGWPGRPHGYRARWDQIDLEDERRPRLLCDVSELEILGTKTKKRQRTR